MTQGELFSRRASPAGLAIRATKSFSAEAVHRGLALTRAGQVTFTEVNQRSATAIITVSRASTLTVTLAAPFHLAGVLRASCTCEGGKGSRTCEHICAALTALEARRLDLGLTGPDVWVERIAAPAPAKGHQAPNPYIVTSNRNRDEADDSDSDDDNDSDENDGDSEDTDYEQFRALERARKARRLTGLTARRSPPQPARRRAVAPVLPPRLATGTWQARLRWVTTRSTRSASLRDSRAPGLPRIIVEFHLTAASPVDHRRQPRALPPVLEIETYQRLLRRDGALGVRKRLQLDPERPASSHVIADPADDTALAALRLGEPVVESIATHRWSEPERSVHRGARTHAVIVDRVLPNVAKTGRLGWIDPQADLIDGVPALQILRWDGDLAFHLVTAIRGAKRGLALHAELVRGDERLPLSAITAFFGGGCVASADRLIRVDGGEVLAQWWAVAGREPLPVPRGQLRALLAQLTALPNLPTLELDPACGLAHRAHRASPTPRAAGAP